MRKLFFLLTLVTLGFLSCKKKSGCDFSESKTVSTPSELASLQDSLTKYGINNAVQHPAGFSYIITEQGTGNTATSLCSTISAKYKGSFFNGKVFDQSMSTPISFTLGQMITGWQKAIPLIKEGGKMKLFLPPSMGYESEAIYNGGQLVIPPYSFLIFEVEVTKIQ